MKSKAGFHFDESPLTHPINIPNKGHKIASNLPEDCILEVAANFMDDDIKIYGVGNVPNDIKELLEVHANNTKLFVDAAISGDPEKLLKALLADPMCKFIDDRDAIEDLMWNMLHYESKWLPQFKESIPTLDDLKKLKHYVDEKDLKPKKRAMKVKWKRK